MKDLQIYKVIPVIRKKRGDQCTYRVQQTFRGDSNPLAYQVFIYPELSVVTGAKTVSLSYHVLGKGYSIDVVHATTQRRVNYEIKHIALGFSGATHLSVVTQELQAVVYALQDDGSLAELSSTSLLAGNPEYEYINLGWGSENTQFKGKRATQAETDKLGNDIGPDVSLPRIVWCETNDMFSVNFYNPALKRRQIKIFDTTCKLLYLGPNHEGMQAAMAWKPPHSTLACAVNTGEGMEIQIYEKLGPIRDSFKLRDKLPVNEIIYSDDGELLAVLQSDGKYSCISIFMLKTGRWYLKQYLPFSEPNCCTSMCFQWTPTKTIYSLLVYTDRVILTFEFLLSTITCRDIFCAETDGDIVQLYMYEKGIVPPSMPQCVVRAPNPINMIRLHRKLNQILVVDCYSNFYIYEFTNGDVKLVSKFEPTERADLHYSIVEACWIDDNIIEYVIWHNSRVNTIVTYNCIDKTSEVEKRDVEVCFWKKFPSYDETFFIGCIRTHCAIFDNHNYIHSADVLHPYHLKLDGFTVNNNKYVIQLSGDNRLMLDFKEIAADVSSFIIHDKYLHFTNFVTNRLITIPLNKYIMKKIYSDHLEVDCEAGRSIETGALLLMGIKGKPDVVLQLPRGNVETIKSEIILLNTIELLIKFGDWYGAHDFIRMQKMDSNVLVDLDIDRFLNKVDDFIRRIESPTLLTQFIEELSDQSSSCQSYFLYYPHKKEKVNRRDKVKRVCDKIVESITKSTTYYEYILPIVSASIYSVPDVDDGLYAAFAHMGSVLDVWEYKAIKYIESGVFYLKNKFLDKKLFNTSLQTLNLNLARLTADTINMDPMEYKPILDKLEPTNVVNQGFILFDYLKKYDKAFMYLVRMKDADKIKAYIDDHDLDEFALQHIPSDLSFLRDEIKELYGQKLSARAKLKDAFKLYHHNTKDVFEVYTAAKSCNLIGDCCFLLGKMSLSGKDREYFELAKKLELFNKQEAAADMYEIYLKDYKKAMDLRIKAGKYRKAYSSALPYFDVVSLNETFEKVLNVNVIMLKENLTDNKNLYEKYSSRLTEVRAKKVLDELLEVEDDASVYADSSIASTSSGQTKSSARQKRRIQRKVTSLREGNKYEEIALVRVLHEVVSKIFSGKEEIIELLKLSHLLKSECKIELIGHIRNLNKVQLDIIKNLPDIWKRDVIDKTEGYDYLDDENINPPEIASVDWVAKILEVGSVLDNYITRNDLEHQEVCGNPGEPTRPPPDDKPLSPSDDDITLD